MANNYGLIHIDYEDNEKNGTSIIINIRGVTQISYKKVSFPELRIFYDIFKDKIFFLKGKTVTAEQKIQLDDFKQRAEEIQRGISLHIIDRDDIKEFEKLCDNIIESKKLDSAKLGSAKLGRTKNKKTSSGKKKVKKSTSKKRASSNKKNKKKTKRSSSGKRKIRKINKKSVV